MSNGQPNVSADWNNNIANFSCHSETAKSVFLAGSFNHWDPAATPMRSDGQGQYRSLLAGAVRSTGS